MMEEALRVLNDVKLVADAAIVLVEHPGGGADKKDKVIGIVKKFISENGISVPIPQAIFDYVLGMAVDLAVGWINANLWKK